MTTLTVTLKDEDNSFLKKVVKAGRFTSESDAMTEAIAELRIREEIRQVRVNELRAKLAHGVDQADNKDFVEFNAADIKARGRKRLEQTVA